MARAAQDSAALAYPHVASSSSTAPSTFTANPSNPPCPLHIGEQHTEMRQSMREFRRRACLPITLHGDASFVGQVMRHPPTTLAASTLALICALAHGKYNINGNIYQFDEALYENLLITFVVL